MSGYNNRYSRNDNYRSNRRGGGGGYRGGGGGGYRGGGRGGGYNRGRGGGGCYKCGQQGHMARDCPSGGGGGYGGGRGGYRGGGGGGYRGGGYRGRGRGGRGGRGRGGRGRGRGGGQRFGGVERSDRFQDKCSSQLISDVNEKNKLDPAGPQQVKCWTYNNGWSKVQSLSQGMEYFYQTQTKKALAFKVVPEECKNVKEPEYVWQDQGSRFAKPPAKEMWVDKKLDLIPNVVTNAYKIDGGIFTNQVHSYLVRFEPELHTKEVLERRNIMLGVTSKEKRRNNQILMNHFGYWAFDNHTFYAMGRDPIKPMLASSELHKEYKVIFDFQNSRYFDETDLELPEEEQLLNIFKRKAMKGAGFNNVGDKWFYRDGNNPPHPAMAPKQLPNGKCTILNGFNCSMRVAMNDPSVVKQSKGATGLFKADLANKLVSSKNVNELIYNMMNVHGTHVGDKAFRNEVSSQLQGKFFVTRYNNSSTRIDHIDFNEDENGTFEWGPNKVKTSYKDYILKQYNIKATKKECCVLKDRRGSVFLPQFCYLTLRSDEVADVYDQVLDATNQPIHERLSATNALIEVLNKSEQERRKDIQSEKQKKNKPRPPPPMSPKTETTATSSQTGDNDGDDSKDDEKQIERIPIDDLSLGLNVGNRSVVTDALELHYPQFIYRCMNNNRQLFDKSVSMASTPKWGGREGTKGFLEDTRTIRKWCIVSERQWAGNKVYNHWEAYCGKRAFDHSNGPLQEPQVTTIDFGGGQEAYMQVAKQRWDMIFLVLPAGPRGSEIKARFTKCVQSQKRVGSNGCLIQCVMEHNAGNPNAVLGAFEDAMAKHGNIMFRVEPPLPADSPYKGKNIWTIGLDVSHTTKGKKPSTAMLVLQTMPFKGTQRGMRCVAHLNKPRTEVIPFAAIVSMTVEALMKEKAALMDKKRRPDIIMVFRDGVPDNALKEVFSKEVVGISRAINIIRKQVGGAKSAKKQNEAKPKREKKWKPLLQFIVVSKSPIEKFGVLDRHRRGYMSNPEGIYPLDRPSVVFRGITNSKLWDFFMWNYHPNKARNIDRIKPLRYVLLKDEMKLKDVPNGAVGLFEIINTLFYTYCFSIPFPLGGTSQPGPIVYAKHYAETFSQMILSSDRSIEDLRLANNLKTRPQVITKLMNLPDLLNGNGNGH